MGQHIHEFYFCSGETLTNLEHTEDIRRADFVDSLLSTDNSGPTTSADVSFHEKLVKSQDQETTSADVSAEKAESMFSFFCIILCF